MPGEIRPGQLRYQLIVFTEAEAPVLIIEATNATSYPGRQVFYSYFKLRGFRVISGNRPVLSTSLREFPNLVLQIFEAPSQFFPSFGVLTKQKRNDDRGYRDQKIPRHALGRRFQSRIDHFRSTVAWSI